jgi:hypothetical protein
MKQKNKEKIGLVIKIILPLLIVASVFAGAISLGIINIAPVETKIKLVPMENRTNETINETKLINATVIIDFGDGTKSTNMIITQHTTVYGFLIEAANIENYDIKTTYYGLYDSTLIDSISSYENGHENNYWIYYINGDSGTVGADKQTVKNGDIIEWKFEKYQY